MHPFFQSAKHTKYKSFFFLLCFIAGLTSTAYAHRVTIFAWTENRTIQTASSFGNGRAAQNATVIARLPDSNAIVAQGKTNSEGHWSFVLPESLVNTPQNIILTLQAGEGHGNTWTVKAQEYSNVSTATHPTASPKRVTSNMDKTSAASSKELTGKNLTGQEETLRRIVSEEVEKRIAPLKHQLAAMQQTGPSIADVFGGIGYILGLFGIAAFVSARRK